MVQEILTWYVWSYLLLANGTYFKLEFVQDRSADHASVQDMERWQEREEGGDSRVHGRVIRERYVHVRN